MIKQQKGYRNEVFHMPIDIYSFRESQYLIRILILILSICHIIDETEGLFFNQLPLSTYPLSYDIIGIFSNQ
jgi:hypothetical protein